MTLSINLPSEIEHVIRERAKAAGLDIEAFVKRVVVEEVADDVARERRGVMSSEEFARRTEAWIKLHPALDHAIDDSRESFYDGRGE